MTINERFKKFLPLVVVLLAMALIGSSVPALAGNTMTITGTIVANKALTALTPAQDTDGAGGSTASIVQVQDAGGSPLAINIKSYAATLSYNSSLINVLGVRHKPSFPGSETINNAAGTTDFNGTAAAGVACPCDLSFLILRLTGTALQQATINLTFTDIRDSAGNPIGQLPPPPQNVFLRGDANADGTVGISDVLYICQYLVGLKNVGMGAGQVHPVNAASVMYDDGYDKVTISDALLIAQYLAGLRGADYQWVP